MKINNPVSFYSDDIKDNTLKESVKKKNKLMIRGDVIRKFSSTDSSNENDWHFIKADNDAWVKYSFDRGETWLLKLKFSNNLIVKVDNKISDNVVSDTTYVNTNNDPRLKAGFEYVFDFSNYSIDTYNAIRNAKIAFLAISRDSLYYTTLPSFRYTFTNNGSQKLNVMFLEDLPEDSVKIQLVISFDGDGTNALIFDSNLGWTDVNPASVTNSVEAVSE